MNTQITQFETLKLRCIQEGVNIRKRKTMIRSTELQKAPGRHDKESTGKTSGKHQESFCMKYQESTRRSQEDNGKTQGYTRKALGSHQKVTRKTLQRHKDRPDVHQEHLRKTSGRHKDTVGLEIPERHCENSS